TSSASAISDASGRCSSLCSAGTCCSYVSLEGTIPRWPMNADSGAVLQAVRGPLMLITLGVLLAIDHAGLFSFWRTWPLLVIIYGVLKLVERVARPMVVSQPPGG